jgi:hypothetical protein
VQLHRARERFQAAGADLVLIGQATLGDAADFRRRQKIELPVLADEHLAKDASDNASPEQLLEAVRSAA